MVERAIGVDRDRLAVLEHVHALGGRRIEPAVERVEQVAVDHRRAVDEPVRVDEVAGALLVHVDGRVGKRAGDVADAAGVVEVDVGDGDAGEVGRRDVELGQRVEQRVDGGLAAGLDQHRLGALDQVAGRDVVPAAEQRVDLDDAGADPGVHPPTLPHVVPSIPDGCRSRLFDEEPTLTVAELNAGIGAVLGRAFPDEVWVRGEIANISRPASGHVYFDLVGDGCALAVTLWASDKQVVNAVLRRAGGAVRMTDGTEVRIRVRVSLVRRARPGVAAHAVDRHRLHARAAGRSARAAAAHPRGGRAAAPPSRLCALPPVPLAVGLVTSDGSAAAHDFLRTLEGSGHAWHVTVLRRPRPGRGGGGIDPRRARRGVRAAEPPLDVVCIVRGGGARTDLAAFDREAVRSGDRARTGRDLDGHRPRDRHHGRRRGRAPPVPHTDCMRDGARRTGHRWCEHLDSTWDAIARAAVASSAIPRSRARLTASDGWRRSRAEHSIERAGLIDATESRVRAFDPARTLARGWSITHDRDGQLDPIERPRSTAGRRNRHDRGRRRNPEHRRWVTRRRCSYTDAVAELQAILDELEHDDIDVDRLSERVARGPRP